MQSTKPNVFGANKSNVWAFWLITILSLFLYNAPIVGLLLSPINTFATMVHELGHAFVCMSTGGSVSGMTIVSDGSGHGGLTFCHGGMPFFYTQAGYLGTAIFGCLLIYFGQYPRFSKAILCLMGATMAIASISLSWIQHIRHQRHWLAGIFQYALGTRLICRTFVCRDKMQSESG